MSRVTLKDLSSMVECLNHRLGKTEEVGSYHLYGAYGGWQLVEMTNDGGGIREVSYGYRSKADLLDFIRGMLVGIQEARNCLLTK